MFTAPHSNGLAARRRQGGGPPRDAPGRAAVVGVGYLEPVLPVPLSFLVGSTSTQSPPFGVGGSVVPLGTVTSLPPFLGLYCPDAGAGWPGEPVIFGFATVCCSFSTGEHVDNSKSQGRGIASYL
jgi:hypothetical protein